MSISSIIKEELSKQFKEYIKKSLKNDLSKPIQKGRYLIWKYQGKWCMGLDDMRQTLIFKDNFFDKIMEHYGLTIDDTIFVMDFILKMIWDEMKIAIKYTRTSPSRFPPGMFVEI